MTRPIPKPHGQRPRGFSHPVLGFELVERPAHLAIFAVDRGVELGIGRQHVAAAQGLRHLGAGLCQRSEPQVERYALERMHRAERGGRVVRADGSAQVLVCDKVDLEPVGVTVAVPALMVSVAYLNGILDEPLVLADG